ncbi:MULTISPECIES: ribbon-helix-helix domain-containing protein [Rhodomicrobium]|uniref:ribbon-helix-helix domain-containing protein n=1 Tax=Rhodomicrobium TaxID=1068 RepID=UPI000B4AF4F7|nr:MULTISPECIES: ribbon-helix-helix domain-containing protein [Rhodomicrobium]
MCQIFSGQNPLNYECETRSIRIDGHVTSIRLEHLFWRTLEELAASQKMTMPQFASKLYDEVLDARGEVKNFASLLRCCCLLYTGNKAAGMPAVEAARPAAALCVTG